MDFPNGPEDVSIFFACLLLSLYEIAGSRAAQVRSGAFS